MLCIVVNLCCKLCYLVLSIEGKEPEAKEETSPAPAGAQSEEVKQRLFGGETASNASENGVNENYFQTSAAATKEG